jgi:hypothetical protein
MIAMMVISAASMAVQQYQSSKARDAAKDAADKQAKLAREAEQNQLKALEEQMEQEKDATELEKLGRERQALRERAKIRVAAAEAGVFGNVTLREMAASELQESQDKGIMDYNLEAKQKQAARRGAAIEINTERDIANAEASVPMGTPTWMAGLQIGLAGASGAMQGASASGYNPFGSGGGTAGGVGAPTGARWSPRAASGM